MSLLNNIWSWVTGKTDVFELPNNICFERDVSPENDFWVRSIVAQWTCLLIDIIPM
jgi:hypothetical protein